MGFSTSLGHPSGSGFWTIDGQSWSIEAISLTLVATRRMACGIG